MNRIDPTQPTPVPPLDRIFYLDAMRGILMILGVVLHSAQIFNPERSWKIWSEHSSGLAAFLVDGIHAFRMPAFFVVSGFLCVVSLLKYPPGAVLKDRMTRLLIPLLVVGFSINILQQWILAKSGWSPPFDFRGYVANGEWISHLWFLINLLVYTAIAAGVAVLARSIGAAGLARPMKWLGRMHPAVIMLVLCVWAPMVPALKLIGFPTYERYLGFINVYGLLHFAVFYFFGAVLASGKNLLDRFCDMSPLIPIGMLLGAFGALTLLGPAPGGAPLVRGAQLYFDGLVSWASLAICFWVFARVFSARSHYIAFLANASYSIYLFHHFLVVCFGLIVIRMEVSAISGMCLVIVAAAAISILVHKFIISKSPVLRLMFNGVPLKKVSRRPVPAN